MDIKIEAETLKQVVGESIMASLTQEKREHLIKSAMEFLLSHEKDYYGVKRSPLEKAFCESLLAVVKEISGDMLSKDEKTRSVIRGLITDAVTKLLDKKNYDGVVERIQKSIADALAGR